MTEALSFRIAVHSDAQLIADLVNSAYRGASGEFGWTHEAKIFDGPRTGAQSLARLLAAENSLILLCMKDSEITGSVHLEKFDGGAYLGLLAVRPAFQGNGTGSRLMAEAERLVRKRWRCEKISMTVISLRSELIEYYERRGYRRTGKIEPLAVDAGAGLPKSADLQLAWLEKRLV